MKSQIVISSLENEVIHGGRRYFLYVCISYRCIDKRCRKEMFGINKIEDKDIIKDILERLRLETEEE